MTIAVSQSESPRIAFHSIKCFSVWGKKRAGLWHFVLHRDVALLFVAARRCASQKPIKIPDVGGERDANQNCRDMLISRSLRARPG